MTHPNGVEADDMVQDAIDAAVAEERAAVVAALEQATRDYFDGSVLGADVANIIRYERDCIEAGKHRRVR